MMNEGNFFMYLIIALKNLSCILFHVLVLCTFGIAFQSMPNDFIFDGFLVTGKRYPKKIARLKWEWTHQPNVKVTVACLICL